MVFEAAALALCLGCASAINDRASLPMLDRLLLSGLCANVAALVWTTPFALDQGIARSWLSTVGLVLLLAFVAPLIEEWLFRRWLLVNLTRRLSWRPANVLQATIFSLAHLPAYGLHGVLLAIFLLGLATAGVCEGGRALLPAIVVHGAFNLMGLTVLSLIEIRGYAPFVYGEIALPLGAHLAIILFLGARGVALPRGL